MVAIDKDIFFLFNHDAAHQAAHLAGIAGALKTVRPDLRITCATGTPALRRRVEVIMGSNVAQSLNWLDLSLSGWMEAALAIPNRLAPVKRLARLDRHAARLAHAAMIISTERTCLRLKRRWSADRDPIFVHVPHGAGDRSVTYHPAKQEFDRILVSGEKAKRILTRNEAGDTERVRIVGYPKFDVVDLDRRVRLFDNDRPVFLYNPHFDPFLSSWYDEGPKLLDWFASAPGQAFNIIVAPHVMLFRKKIHASLDYRIVRIRPDIKAAWRNAANIVIDTDSDRLVDMSYTLSADAYIGDVSSQIYEFLIRPRAAFFIDRFSDDPRSREGRYAAWTGGDVVKSTKELIPMLGAHVERSAHYRARQRALFADTISYNPARSATLRSVDAIVELLDR